LPKEEIDQIVLCIERRVFGLFIGIHLTAWFLGRGNAFMVNYYIDDSLLSGPARLLKCSFVIPVILLNRSAERQSPTG
jgi:hypothetical protein